MRYLRPSAVLLFYDFPQVFVGKDDVDTRHVCMVTHEGDDGPSYICTPISAARENDLLSGKLDLRSVFAQPEIIDLHIGQFSSQLEGELELTSARLDVVPQDLLPAEGLFFDSYDEVALNAAELNTTVSHVSLGVPEASEVARIHSSTLGDFLGIFQTVVRNLARFQANLAGKRLKRDDDSFNTDVYGFAKGSFTVKFRPSNGGDMFGEVPAFSAALESLSEFLALANNPDAAIEFLQTAKGHTAASLIALLGFLAEKSCPIDVKWATPSMIKSSRVSAPLSSIVELVSRCRQRSDLSIEEVKIVGSVLAADFDNNTWKLVSEQDKETYSGEIYPGSNATLRGMIITDARYEFICDETIEVVQATGREIRHLFLKSVKKL